MWTTVVLLLGLSRLSLSKPHVSKRWDEFEVKHAWANVPNGWELHGPAPSDYEFDMRIGLKQGKFDELVSHLYEVSDPAHARYGQHLTKEQVDALIAPRPDSVELVESWIAAHDLDLAEAQRSHAGEWVTIRVSVEQAERMLGTKYSVFRHGKSDEYVVRTMNYSLPAALIGHVDVVAPTTYFGTMKTMKATSFINKDAPIIETDEAFQRTPGVLNELTGVPASCAQTVTPTCLRALYKTAGYVPTATDRNSLGVAGYLGQYANRADLQDFFKRFRSDLVGTTYETVLLNGGLDDQNKPGFEANLDIQYAIGISAPTPNIYYSTGGSPPFVPDSRNPRNGNEPYLDWLNFLAAQDSIPQTFTTSYADHEQTVPADYAAAVCNAFAQLGARGSSFLFASGDWGVGGGDCATNDGRNATRFQPMFPASCPFVTAVGGTEGLYPEVAVKSFGSGGGFSNYFARPAYQNAAVERYLAKLGSTHEGLYNATGRGFPDISAQGDFFQVVIRGNVTSIGGTSASTPTVAGIISLVNDFRLSRGKPSLGFLNPLLYSIASSFNDVTSGNNPGCGTDGFSAIAGWDPVTGLGTPNFLKLKALLG